MRPVCSEMQSVLVKGLPDAAMNTTPEFRREKASVGGSARYRPSEWQSALVAAANRVEPWSFALHP